ncbi:hypothetical protein D823_02936 [Streptococcus sobrinus DSM 20742 = ATCC 33478]|nr:hypothetical protein D823_02936 [Streptococcus sobrinus DSM 20742 = ATCC 33478]
MLRTRILLILEMIIMPEVKENPSWTETFIDLKTLDGDLWGNYLAIKWPLEKFAKDKLQYGYIHHFK